MIRATAPPTDEDTDLRSFLQRELALRCARNPRYSLRAFARQLGLDHSTLSQLLRGRRALAVRTIDRISARLGLSNEQSQRFVEAERATRRNASSDHGSIRRLGRDVAVLLSDWRHFAILELTRLDSFQSDSRWIARVLGTTVDEVNVAVQRLLRFGFLEMTDAARWTARTPVATVTVDQFIDAISTHLAARAEDHALRGARRRDPRPRDRSETTLAVDSRNVNAALEIMERCRADVTNRLTAGDRKDDVYRLEISLVPVTITKP